MACRLLCASPCGASRRRSSGVTRASAAEASTQEDTIVGAATPVVAAAGGVAVVRLSGRDALAVAAAAFEPAGASLRHGAWAERSHVAAYGRVVSARGETLDEALALPFHAPRSYTAEDVVELHVHGGTVCVQRAMQRCVELGARLAAPGEFTLRAFLNGRLDLAQAEAVHAVVASRTADAASAALSALRGGLSAPVRTLRADTIALVAELDARLDFEDEMPPLDPAEAAARVAGLRQEVDALLATANRGRLLDAGATVAIVGRPNVGKSSLLNAWSRSERAIVTDVPGTTRDVVEAQVAVGGVAVTLLDTAGIRGDAADAVESIGIERSRAAAAGADALIMVVDATAGWTEDDELILREAVAPGVPAVLATNKADTAPTGGASIPPEALERFDTVVSTSATAGTGLDALEAAVHGAMGLDAVPLEGAEWAVNQRQAEALVRASEALERVESTIAADLPVDFWTIDLRDAALALGAVTGEDVTEDVLDTVFSKFCIGK